MAEQDLIIKISGSIHFQEDRHEFKNFDNEILHRLDESRKEILDKIRFQITRELDKDIEIDLHFEKGSIILTGIAIIKWISITGGVFSFIDYASRIVRRVITQVLENWLMEHGPMPLRPHVIISTSPNSQDFQQTPTNNQNANPNNIFSLKTILIAITLINIILFLGGNIYNFFTVQSTKDQYIKSKEELIDLNSDLKLLFTEIELSQLKAKFALENLPDKLENEFSIPLQNKRDSLLTEVSLIKKDLKKLHSDLITTNSFYNDSTLTITRLLTESKNKKDIRIGFKDMNWQVIATSLFSLFNLILIVILFITKEKK